jgi:hypothetical protein
MQTTLLTRAEYDLLVKYRPEFMRVKWRRNYNREWSLAGVTAQGGDKHTEELKAELDAAERARDAADTSAADMASSRKYSF